MFEEDQTATIENSQTKGRIRRDSRETLYVGRKNTGGHSGGCDKCDEGDTEGR